jgi:hypothetical protein
MCINNTPDALRSVKCDGEAGAGLVPYTTSDTSPKGSNLSSVPLLVSSMPTISAGESRLKRLKHHVRTASRLIKETMHREGRKWRALFVTLTYRPGVQWSPRHVTGFLKNVRMWAKRQGTSMGYVWVAEMQKRGAVHYHAVVWIRSSLKLPRPDKKGWWRHGSTNVQSVKKNAIGYLMKYVSKGFSGDDPDLPSGCRVCGSGGMDSIARDEFHYWRLPRYVRENVVIGERCRRAPGGGWVSTLTGESWRSDYGIFAFAFRDRANDCNGRKRRQDSLVILSNEYRREKGSFVLGSGLVELVESAHREQAWYDLRVFTLGALYPDAA